MKTHVVKMLAQGIISESKSPWAAPTILVPKKSPDGKTKFRFCVDFRALNAVTKFDSYPLPVFEETTSTLHGSRYFSVLDCYSGFWQNNIKDEQIPPSPLREVLTSQHKAMTLPKATVRRVVHASKSLTDRSSTTSEPRIARQDPRGTEKTKNGWRKGMQTYSLELVICQGRLSI